MTLSLYDFPHPGYDPTIFYCQYPATYPLTCTPGGLGVVGEPLPAKELVPIQSDGTGTATFEVQPAVPGSDQPFQGWNPASDQNTNTTFFCDNDPGNQCSLDIVIPGAGDVTDPSPQNTGVVPLSFLPNSAGCPDSAPAVSIYNSYSVERLMPIVSIVACQGSSPVVAANTSTGSNTVSSGVTTGLAQLGFTDDPQDPTEQQELAHSGGHFALIPVAVSATAVGFKAQQQNQFGDLVPDQTFNLTPDMVAGIVPYIYTGWQHDDAAIKAGTCPKILKHHKLKEGTCPIILAVNPAPQGYRSAPSVYASFYLRPVSGSTSELTGWICQAPNPPVSIDGASYTDPNRSSVTFTTTNGQVAQSQWPIQSCSTIDQLPSFPGIGGSFFNSGSSPVDAGDQALNAIYNNSSRNAVAAFSTMDSSDADYLGLSVAALQNASGNFVLPTTQSVTAALNDATTNPDGTLSPNFSTSDPNAYPMPMVTYAIVPTDPIPADEAAADKALLLNMLSVTGGSNVGSLPEGYFPLPSNLYNEAVSELNKDITAQPGSGGGGGGSGSGGGNGGPLAPLGTSPLGASPLGDSSGTPTSTSPLESTKAAASSAKPASSSRRGRFFLVSTPLLGGALAWLIPLLIASGAAMLVLGPAMFFSPELRRRLRNLSVRDLARPLALFRGGWSRLKGLRRARA